MFNSSDTRQLHALVGHRQEQVAADVAQTRRIGQWHQSFSRGVGPFRAVIGVLLMRAGARIAGASFQTGPDLRTGV
ncbi:MAG: hypothetical protein EA415_11170 [Sphaerobacteraceae bacterium]|nr:MAG: hypothetical protein EA415_11170 [Sphaerobacteraceae bacterium]